MENISKYPEALKDPASRLALQKNGGVNFPENYYALRWEELHDLRSRTKKGCEAILGKVEKDKRDLSEDETRGFNLGMACLDAIQSEFEAREQAGTKEPLFTGSLNDVVQKAPVSYSSVPTEKALGPASRRDYRSLFAGQGDRAEFNSLGDFLSSIVNRLKDPRLDKRAFIVKDATLGGFAVPELWTGQIFDAALEGEIVRSRCAIFPMDSEVLHVPCWDNSNHTTGNLYGGFTGVYLSEDTTADIQTGKLRSVTLKSKKLGIFTEISREAATSAVSLEAQLRTKLVSAVSFYMDKDLLAGSGVNQPQGILNSPSVINVARATANQIAYSDIYGLYSRLYPACQNNAVWIMSNSALPQLLNMTVASELVFVNGIASSMPLTLFGRPILFTEKTPSLGSRGDVMLCDLSQYALGLRQELLVETSNAPGWQRDTISLRCIIRFDGASLWQNAITPSGGGSTLSWAVCLE